MFLGLAYEKLNKYDEAEMVYYTAANSKPTDPLAWQGLIALFEKQAGKRIDQYQEVAARLAECYLNVYVMTQLADAINTTPG